MKQIFAIVIALFIISCNKQEKIVKTENNNHLLMATLFQQQSPEYKALTTQLYKMGFDVVRSKYILSGKTADNFAIVLDIDETVLDNSPFEAKCIIENTSYPEYWDEWMNEENADLVPGVEEFLFRSDTLGYQIFYVSNRKAKYLKQTINNLNKHNLPQVDSTHILLRTESSSKVNRRKFIEEELGYKIVYLIGDNLNDFSGEFEIEDNNERAQKAKYLQDRFISDYLLLPNPMYGEWEKALLNGSYDYSKSERDSILISKLKSF